jgi:hypothetical protein
MNALHAILSHYWGIPFALSLALPRRALAAVSAPVVPALIVANIGNEARVATACVIALGMALAVALGRGLGGALRSTPGKGKDGMAKNGNARKRAIIGLVALGGLLMLPGSLATAFAALAHEATVRMQTWEARMPSAACLAERYPVSVGGATYYLPAAPVITVRTAGPAYHFQYGRSLRKLCARRAGTTAPLRATGLDFDFTIPSRGAFCRAATGRWGQGLCDAAAGADSWPAMANVYLPEEYDRQHLMPAPTYASFAADQAKAAASGHPFQPQAAGAMDRYGNGYWVSRNGAWKNDAGEPYTLRCQDTDAPGVLSCETSYRLKAGPQLTYRFTAPARLLPQTAQSMERHVHAMLDAFSTAGTPPAPRPARR